MYDERIAIKGNKDGFNVIIQMDKFGDFNEMLEALLNKYNIDSKGFTDDKSAYMAIQQKINSDQNSNECALYDGKNFRIVTNNCFKGNTITITDDHNIKIGGTDYALSITDKEIQFQSATVNGEFTEDDIKNFNNAVNYYQKNINNLEDIPEASINLINAKNPFSQLVNIKSIDDYDVLDTSENNIDAVCDVLGADSWEYKNGRKKT